MINIKTRLITCGFISLLLITVVAAYWLFHNPFPSDQEIKAFFSEIEKSDSKYIRIKKFLNQIRYSKNVEQDYLVEEIIERLTRLYFDTEDTNILKAFDDTKIDAGFANFVCGSFYCKVIMNEKAKLYYRANSKPLERCLGLCFSEEEIGEALKY